MIAVPPRSVWTLTSISLYAVPHNAEHGQVVVSIAPLNKNGTVGEQIAIASLRVADVEVAHVDLSFNSVTPIVVFVSNVWGKGPEVAVVLNGTITMAGKLIVKPFAG
jgi:hypothetical protein